MAKNPTGAMTMAAAAALGLAASLYAYVVRGSGIDHTAGALLVLCSCAALMLASLILALAPGAPAWLRTLLIMADLLDILGTGVAAWFLHAWLLLALMVVALVGWLALLVLPGRHGLKASATVKGFAP